MAQPHRCQVSPSEQPFLVSAGEMASEFKKRKTSDEPLLSGPWNDFSFLKPEGFQLPTLKKEAGVPMSLLAELASVLPSPGEQAQRIDRSIPVPCSAALESSSGNIEPSDHFHDTPGPSTLRQESEVAQAPFVGMLVPECANLQARTENNAATFSSSGSSLVDFFFQVVEGSKCSLVHDLLTKVRLLHVMTMLRFLHTFVLFAVTCRSSLITWFNILTAKRGTPSRAPDRSRIPLVCRAGGKTDWSRCS